MKFPSVYVTSQFLDEMDNYWNKFKESRTLNFDDEIDEKIESLKRIRNLFLASDFLTDLKAEDLLKYKEGENLEFKNFKDFLLRKLVMNDSDGDKPKINPDQRTHDFDRICCSYFLSQSKNHSNNYSLKHGKIVLGKSFLEKPFYLNHSFSVEYTTSQIPQASRIAHPCSSLLILDSYLFSNANGKASQKANNLIRFLKSFVPSDLKRIFEIDIITFETDRKTIKALYDRISKEIQIKFSLHVYFTTKGNFDESDRYFITEYSITVIGHPLDRDSYISSTFIPSNYSVERIQKSTQLWSQKLNSAKNIINKLHSEDFGPRFYWKSEEFENSSHNEKSHGFRHRLFNLE
jgi:hypothetical protein